MNRVIAFFCLWIGVCLAAGSFAQDSHISLVKEYTACVRELVSVLGGVKKPSDADEAVKKIKAIKGKMLALDKRKLALPRMTVGEDAHASVVMDDFSKAVAEFKPALDRLVKNHLNVPALQQALVEFTAKTEPIREEVGHDAMRLEPFAKDADGNTLESLLQEIVNETGKLKAVLEGVKDAATDAAAVAQVYRYRAIFLDIVQKRAALPVPTESQLDKLRPMEAKLARLMNDMVKPMTAMMTSFGTSEELKTAVMALLNSFNE